MTEAALNAYADLPTNNVDGTDAVSGTVAAGASTLLGHHSNSLHNATGAQVNALRAEVLVLSGQALYANDLGVRADGATDDTSAWVDVIAAAIDPSAPNVARRPIVWKGQSIIKSQLDILDQYGLALIGLGGPDMTGLVWGGASGETMLRLRGLRRPHFEGFRLLGKSDQSTTAITLDGTPGGIVSSEGVFDRVQISRHRYGVRIGGQDHYQADVFQWRQMLFADCAEVAVSIEDANALQHNFYGGLFQRCGKGISATHFLDPNGSGTGGGFNCWGTFFLEGRDWDLQLYANNRGNILSGVAHERGVRFVYTTPGSTGLSATLEECSVYGHRYTETLTISGSPAGGTFTLTYKGGTTTALAYNASAATIQAALEALGSVAAGEMIVYKRAFLESDGSQVFHIIRAGSLEFDTTAMTTAASLTGGTAPTTAIAAITEFAQFGATGAITFRGGKYQTQQGGAHPWKIRIFGNNQRRTNVIADGTIFDGDPFVAANNFVFMAAVVRGIQTRAIMDVTVPANIDGPVAYGSALSPKAFDEGVGAAGFQWMPAVWVKIPSGTALSAGVNTFVGTSKNCAGLCTIQVESVFAQGGLVQPFTITAKDTHGSVASTFTITVTVGTTFTLTSDLVFKLVFNPEFVHV